jgi:hypothetical protein
MVWRYFIAIFAVLAVSVIKLAQGAGLRSPCWG